MENNEQLKEQLHAKFYSMHILFYTDENNKNSTLMNFIAELEYCYKYYENNGELLKCKKLLQLLKNNTYYKDKKLRFYEDNLPKNVVEFVHNLFMQCSKTKLRSVEVRTKVNQKIIQDFEK